MLGEQPAGQIAVALQRRIDELEHGAGSLFENAPGSSGGEAPAGDGAAPGNKFALPPWIQKLK